MEHILIRVHYAHIVDIRYYGGDVTCIHSNSIEVWLRLLCYNNKQWYLFPWQAAEAERQAVEEARRLAEEAQAAALAAATAEREEKERLEAEAAAARAEAERREKEALAKEEEARVARDELEQQRYIPVLRVLIVCVGTVCTSYTLQEENFHWNLTSPISLNGKKIAKLKFCSLSYF